VSCCAHVQPLIDALVAFMAHTDKLYLAPDLREATTQALVAKANAEARICIHCRTHVAGPITDVGGTP